MKKWKLALVSGIAVLTLSACSDKDEKIVSMTHTSITQEAFYEELKNQHGADILEAMVQESILLDKYKVTNEEMDTRMAYYKNVAGVDTDEDFETYLKAAGYDSLDDFKEDLRFNIAQVKAVTEGVKIEEKDVKAAYEEQKTQVSASHILITDKETAESVHASIEKGEKTFEEMVAEHSEDSTTAANNGSLGFFGKGGMVAEFEEAAFSMKKGDISEPVLSEYGYHIIRVDDTKVVPFEELELIIREELEMEQAKDYNTVLQSLKDEYKIEILDKDIKKLVEPAEAKQE